MARKEIFQPTPLPSFQSYSSQAMWKLNLYIKLLFRIIDRLKV